MKNAIGCRWTWREHLRAEVVDQALANPRRVEALDDVEQPVQEGKPGDGGGDREHDADPARQDALVDDDSEQHGDRHGDHCVQRGRQQEDREIPAVRPRVARDPADESLVQLLLGHRRVGGEAAHHVKLGGAGMHGGGFLLKAGLAFPAVPPLVNSGY